MSAPVRLITVPGTHGRSADRQDGWDAFESPWWDYMRRRGFTPVGERPFVWDTELNGWQFWRRWFRAPVDHHSWKVGGENAVMYVKAHDLDPEHTHFICHSHADKLILYAAAYCGLKIQTLTSICSPVRADTQPTAAKARANIRFWQHVHSDGSDRWQALGAFGDGRIGVQRSQPLADINHTLPQIGHSGILHDAALFGVWEVLGDNIRKHDGASL